MPMMVTVKAAGWLICCAALFGAKPAPTVVALDPAGLKAADLTLYWQSTTPLEPHERLRRMVRLDENLYLLTDQGAVIALDAATGMLRWSAQLASRDIRIHGPTHGPKLVYFTTTSGVHGLDRATGELKLRWKGPFAPSGPAVSDGQTLYVGGTNGRMYAVRLSDLAVLWQFMTDGMVSARPAVVGSALFTASQDGVVYACQKADKQRLWVSDPLGPILADLAASGDCLYVAGTRQSLDCYDPAKGRLRWRVRMPGPLYAAPRIIGPRLYQHVDQHGLWCLDRQTGKVLWRRGDALDVLAEHKDLVWLRTNHGSLQGVDKATGKVQKEIVCGARLWAANEVDDAIYVATVQGKVFCLRPWEVGYLRYEQVARAGIRATGPGAVEKPVAAPSARPEEDHLKASEGIPPIGGTGVLTVPPGGEGP